MNTAVSRTGYILGRVLIAALIILGAALGSVLAVALLGRGEGIDIPFAGGMIGTAMTALGLQALIRYLNTKI